jgi:hypothetical protein
MRNTYRQHLVSLVEDEELDSIGLEGTTLDHVVDTSRSADNDVDTILQNLHIITDNGAANAGMALDIHEVANGDNDLLDLLSKLTSGSENQGLALLNAQVNLLENRDGEGSRLSSAGLSLCDNVAVWSKVSLWIYKQAPRSGETEQDV